MASQIIQYAFTDKLPSMVTTCWLHLPVTAKFKFNAVQATYNQENEKHKTHTITQVIFVVTGIGMASHFYPKKSLIWSIIYKD